MVSVSRCDPHCAPEGGSFFGGDVTDQLLGPLALTVGLIIAVGVLWRLVRDYITELQTSRDRWRELAFSYEAKFDEQTEALRLLPTLLAALERVERRMDTR